MREGFSGVASQYQVVVSNSAPYFVYHQSNQPREKLPRRVMMKMDNKRKELIVKIIQESVGETLKNRSFNTNVGI